MANYGMSISVTLPAEDSDEAFDKVKTALSNIGATVEVEDGPDELEE